MIVGGQMFLAPVSLLLQYTQWRLLLTGLQRPAQGWVLPNIEAELFGLLIECLVSPTGFEGSETDINLVKLFAVTSLALEWQMGGEVTKLKNSIYRYLVKRILFNNPHHADYNQRLDHGYYMFRSEELYRAWEIASSSHVLSKIMNTGEFCLLYAQAIPQDIWPALTSQFDPVFETLLDVVLLRRERSPNDEFFFWFEKFFKQAGYLEFTWLAGTDTELDGFFQETAARAQAYAHYQRVTDKAGRVGGAGNPSDAGDGAQAGARGQSQASAQSGGAAARRDSLHIDVPSDFGVSGLWQPSQRPDEARPSTSNESTPTQATFSRPDSSSTTPSQLLTA